MGLLDHTNLDGPDAPIELAVNSLPVKLKNCTQSIVVNNIPSMAQGVNYWGNGPSSPADLPENYTRNPGIGDGRFELMAGETFMSVVKLSLGVTHYKRLAQPRRLDITIKRTLPIMIDGESVIAEPGTLTIAHKGNVLCPVGTVTDPRGLTEPSSELLKKFT